jgi:hypothetical protein
METKLNQIGRRFALSEMRGVGVSCSEDGVFVGSVPLLSNRSADEADQWQPRAAPDLNRELGKYYGLPVEFDSKMAGLATVAQALNRIKWLRDFRYALAPMLDTSPVQPTSH